MSFVEKLKRGIETNSAEEMQQAAEAFLAVVPPNSTVALHGDLGAGKTTFVAGLGKALGIQEPITSPTFTLINIYKGRYLLVHLDAYRLSKPEAAEALCLEDILETPYCLAIEWPEKASPLLSERAFHLYFTCLSNGSRVVRLG